MQNAAAVTVLVLGDSIGTAHGIAPESGWVALLQKRLNGRSGTLTAKHTVINASVNGATTGDGLRRLPALLERHDPDIVIVELGGNDGLNRLPTARIEANLAALVKTSHAAGVRALLVGIPLIPKHGRRYAEAHRRAFENVAQRLHAPLAALRLEDALKPGMLQSDGIHPAALAQPLLMETVWRQLKKMLPPAGQFQ